MCEGGRRQGEKAADWMMEGEWDSSSLQGASLRMTSYCPQYLWDSQWKWEGVQAWSCVQPGEVWARNTDSATVRFN